MKKEFITAVEVIRKRIGRSSSIGRSTSPRATCRAAPQAMPGVTPFARASTLSHSGPSCHSSWHDCSSCCGWIRSYSAAPLRVIHLLALVFFAFSLWLGSKALYLKLTGHAVDGFTTVILLILILGAFLLLGLAVIAEFIIAIYDEVKARPRYVVSEWVGEDARPASTSGR